MLTVLVDYDSGNLHSAEKAFQRMSSEVDGGDVIVSSLPEDVARADRIVLPGDGAFPACRNALTRDRAALFEAIVAAVIDKARPFMGICVGMQMMATWGREYEDTKGFDWVGGEIAKITPSDPVLKVPHMGWNDLVLDPSATAHPVLTGIRTGDHAYFVHSYSFRVADAAHRLAHVEYGGDITAIVGRDNMIGMQFHPEKSQTTGLKMIANFLKWAP
ncbi:imidazole glycerol phosphate synthase subunit HisH [Litoreibacter janthinus]|uniref:Imidazole glycerol phosphate synthase subunit HisH n=1 Tax=Litoreibacter janthinus TaxID=670154 RepID=A0A1I6GM92_9RHOB|nr:imidazole glycerol phosphate synthase subunit HisH [Litoreibacter janthinus]SFR43290.1 glutamine amidotransferase [Litoreibacter janthinus]